MSKSIVSQLKKTRVPIGAAVLAMLILLGSMSPVFSQSTTTKPAPAKSTKAKKGTSKAGSSISVGQKFTPLNLKDQTGKVFDYDAALKKGSVALVIFRSADW